MEKSPKSLKGKKVWFRTLTGRVMTGTVEDMSDETGLIWVETDEGTKITSMKSIEAAGRARQGLSSRRCMERGKKNG